MHWALGHGEHWAVVDIGPWWTLGHGGHLALVDIGSWWTWGCSGQLAVGAGQWVLGNVKWAMNSEQWPRLVGCGNWTVGSVLLAVGSGQQTLGSGHQPDAFSALYCIALHYQPAPPVLVGAVMVTLVATPAAAAAMIVGALGGCTEGGGVFN